MTQTKVLEVTDVAPVWAGHPVSFTLLTRGKEQYVSYYDANRDMTLSKRVQSEGGTWSDWQTVKVPEGNLSPVFGEKGSPTRTAWDSHNYVAIAFDTEGQLHLSGNMHVRPLLYFRTERPGDLTSLKRIDYMTGLKEADVTYPNFFYSPNDELVYSYRDGSSGDGSDFYNIYDTATQTWRRLLDVPITDGRESAVGKGNQTAYAYARGPLLGPDGWYHLNWVWRDDPNCNTNHSLSYVRSRDLVHWEDSKGNPQTLPITPLNRDVVVDPVPIKGGMFNGNTPMGFDAEGRVIVTYHKFDADGNTQVYNARLESGEWRIVQASRWNYRWNFSGWGSMIVDVKVGPVTALPDGRLRQAWWNRQDGEGGTYLDPDTLEPTETYHIEPRYPEALLAAESSFPNMEVHLSEDGANPLEKETVPTGQGENVRYVLRWETLTQNRDEPYEGTIPPPSMLRVYKLAVME